VFLLFYTTLLYTFTLIPYITYSTLPAGNYDAAETHLDECLVVLGRPSPSSLLQLWTSLLWQAVRQVLHRIYIARLFARQASKICPDVAKCSRDAATVYYNLLQLCLTKKVRSTANAGFMYYLYLNQIVFLFAIFYNICVVLLCKSRFRPYGLA